MSVSARFLRELPHGVIVEAQEDGSGYSRMYGFPDYNYFLIKPLGKLSMSTFASDIFTKVSSSLSSLELDRAAFAFRANNDRKYPRAAGVFG